MATSPYIDKPEWVVLGIARSDGVTLLASKDLTHADLTVKYEQPSIRDTLGMYETLRTGRLTCDIGKFFYVVGHDYVDAFKHLAQVIEQSESLRGHG